MDPETYAVRVVGSGALAAVSAEDVVFSVPALAPSAASTAIRSVLDSGSVVTQSHRSRVTYSECRRVEKTVYGNLRTRFPEKTVKEFRDLIDHYFEPFGVQNCRMLLHSADVDATAWRWKLDRVAQEFARINETLLLKPLTLKDFIEEVVSRGEMQHARLVSRLWDRKLMVELKYEPDFRFPVLNPCAPEWVSGYLLELQDSLPSPPSYGSIVLSYAAGRLEGPPTTQGPTARRRWHNRVLRQLLAYHADVICVQQCDAWMDGFASSEGVPATRDASVVHRNAFAGGDGATTLLAALCHRLEREDYEWCAAPVGNGGPVTAPATASASSFTRANVIFWRRSKWRAKACGSVAGGAVHARLQPHSECLAWELSVGCLETVCGEDLREQVRALAGGGHARMSRISHPAVLCGSFGLVGPAQVGAALRGRESFLGSFRSVHSEVLGAEPSWTWAGPEDGIQRCSDGIWLGGGSCLSSLAALSGPRHPPPRTPNGCVDRSVMPCDHLPILAALEYTPIGGLPALPALTCGGAKRARHR
eukprot:TRINITY_DN20073_c0_g1_i1.p1 TRINITY_DN20073_c0_g1~~TRINITY_DN20073_c0_g1_i1.p1  ORF type:complete len:585 (+),score=63.00 TRINITY_DN20073_c0_g1_i1:155-1756(+)